MDGATVVKRSRNAIAFTRPIDGTLRGAMAALGGGLVAAGVSLVGLLQPGLAAFPDAFVWFGCGGAVMLGSALTVAAVGGVERTVTFSGGSSSVIEDVRMFGGLAVRRRLGFESCGALGALREDRGDGGARWHLFLIDGEDGAAVAVGAFGSEDDMRGSVAAITAIRPDFALG